MTAPIVHRVPTLAAMLNQIRRNVTKWQIFQRANDFVWGIACIDT
ncbi:hypothetical protein [Burkholderia perseverans]|nr:hypothetical protein [Burkholderia perseverans]